MGCRGCSEAETLRKGLRIAEAAADGALGVLADVQNILTERAIDPTPFGQKEEETLTRLQELIRRFVDAPNDDVSRETDNEEEENSDVETSKQSPQALVGTEVKGKDSGGANPAVNRARPHGLGHRSEHDGHVRFDRLSVSGRPLESRKHPRGR